VDLVDLVLLVLKSDLLPDWLLLDLGAGESNELLDLVECPVASSCIVVRCFRPQVLQIAFSSVQSVEIWPFCPQLKQRMRELEFTLPAFDFAKFADIPGLNFPVVVAKRSLVRRLDRVVCNSR
jgi:hypothetical protein